MASAAGKKGKKSKGKTLNLQEFLADENQAQPPAGQAVVIAPRKFSSWADEVENEEDSGGMYESSKERVVLPTAPRSARNNDVDEDRVPHQPPFLAYMSNLPYDLEEADLMEFFGKLKIMKVRLPKDDREPNRLKGFGYVEFEERADLKEALGMTDTSLKNRRIRIEVSDNDGGRRGGGMRDRESSDRLLMTDWRSSSRDDSQPQSDDRGFGRRDYGRDRDRGGFSDRSTWGDRNRGDSERSFDRGGGGGGFDRDRGFGNERYEGRGNFDRYGDRRGGSSGGGSYRRGGYEDSRRDDRSEAEPPRERPKLNLAPRTKPLPEEAAANKTEEPAQVAETTPAPVSSSAIFGGAKPVDTLARELEIEDRLAKQKAAAPKPEEAEKPPPPPSQPSWRSEKSTRPPEERRDERKEGGDSNRYQPPKGNYQSRSGQSPVGRRDGGRPTQQRDGPPRSDDKPRRTDDRPSRKEEKPRKNDDAPPRMPKFEENRAPDFVQNNVFAALPDEDVECD